MRRNLSLTLGMMVAAGLLAGTGLAQAPGGGAGMGSGVEFGGHRPPLERSFGDHGRWWHNPDMVAKLKLTDDQTKAMDDTLQQHRETLVDLRGTLEKAELDLEPMMKQDQPNESQILAQIDKVAAARAELEKANARFLLAIRSKMTPEQRKTLEAEMASRPHGLLRGGTGNPQWQGRRGGQAPDGQGAPPPPPGGPQSMLGDQPGVGGPGAGGPPEPAELGGAEFE